ncbi:hypothetical protein GGR54DRAFT_187978 [Hypoxylon sp. NC1633]|nr:hypothetical protein GGR54DRAFT_187978 [Hypoxylon sp. NC1633]
MMFARLRSEQVPTPLRTNSPVRQRTLKHRLFDEDKDDEIQPSPPKRPRQEHYSVASLFNKHKRARVDEDDQHVDRVRSRRQRPSPSPDPDPPLVTELDARYSELRVTLHSAALSSLATAETELVALSESDIRANRQAIAALELQVSKLVAPLQDLTVDYTATDPDGHQRTAEVAIREAVAAFEGELARAVDDLNSLWASWDEAQAEIERLGCEMLGKRCSPGDGLEDGAGATQGVPHPSASHADAAAEFTVGLDKTVWDVVEEMAAYEKKFLKEIEKETGNILESYLNT